MATFNSTFLILHSVSIFAKIKKHEYRVKRTGNGEAQQSQRNY